VHCKKKKCGSTVVQAEHCGELSIKMRQKDYNVAVVGGASSGRTWLHGREGRAAGMTVDEPLSPV
jgi:hypothetical protein